MINLIIKLVKFELKYLLPIGLVGLLPQKQQLMQPVPNHWVREPFKKQATTNWNDL